MKAIEQTSKFTKDITKSRRKKWQKRHAQRWSPRGRPWLRRLPRGHILKSLASKVKSLALASRPQVLENWPVLGSRTALVFELLKFRGAVEKFLWRPFFFGDRLKKFCEDLFFFREHLRLCPWSSALASSIPVLGLESVCPRKGCPWPWPRIFLCPWPRALCSRLHLWTCNWKFVFLSAFSNVFCEFWCLFDCFRNVPFKWCSLLKFCFHSYLKILGYLWCFWNALLIVHDFVFYC